MQELVWLDLCSGLGGASQPALDRGWKVVRVDIEPRFKPDIVADVRTLPLKPSQIDVLWASPPCQEFSKHGLRCFFPNPPAPDISIAVGVLRAIERFQPRYWIVENVWAARPWLCQIFGPVRAMPPGHALWSNLAFLLPNLPAHKGSLSGKRWGDINHWGAPDRKNAQPRASVIPYEIGEAICLAVENRLSRTVGESP